MPISIQSMSGRRVRPAAGVWREIRTVLAVRSGFAPPRTEEPKRLFGTRALAKADQPGVLGIAIDVSPDRRAGPDNTAHLDRTPQDNFEQKAAAIVTALIGPG